MMNLDNGKARANGGKPQQAPRPQTKPTQPSEATALATVNNFELAGKMKAVDRKTELVEIARNAYREEMATLPDDISAMLTEEDLALDVPDFFGLASLNSEAYELLGSGDAAQETQAIEAFAVSA